MKRLVKWPIKLAWRAIGPVRRPVVPPPSSVWLDRYVVMTSHAATEEANLGLDFASAETRPDAALQVQALRGAVEVLPGEGLALVAAGSRRRPGGTNSTSGPPAREDPGGRRFGLRFRASVLRRLPSVRRWSPIDAGSARASARGFSS